MFLFKEWFYNLLSKLRFWGFFFQAKKQHSEREKYFVPVCQTLCLVKVGQTKLRECWEGERTSASSLGAAAGLGSHPCASPALPHHSPAEQTPEGVQLQRGEGEAPLTPQTMQGTAPWTESSRPSSAPLWSDFTASQASAGVHAVKQG